MYSKENINGIYKRKYLYGILKAKENKFCIKTYLLGIPIFKKNKPQLQSIIEDLNYLKKSVRNIFYNMDVVIKSAVKHNELLKYKNCNIGKTVVLYAGGPTVKYYNEELGNDVIRCGINGIIKLKDNLNYLFVEDFSVEEDDWNHLIDIYKGNNCKKFYGILPYRRLSDLNRNRKFTERIKPVNIYDSNAEIFFVNDVLKDRFAIDIDIEPIGDFGGAIFSALQILLYTKPKNIYLVGSDCTNDNLAYETKVPHTSHSGKINGFNKFKKFHEQIYPDINIISINPVGLRGYFKDVYTKSYLEDNPKLKEKLGEQVEFLE